MKAHPSWERSSPFSLPMHAEFHGDSGPPMVFLHGFGANGHTWNRWLPQLTDRHRCLVVEMKGAGSSPKPRGEDYGPGGQAQLLLRLILQKELREVTLVGHSLGGGIALITAQKLLQESPHHLKALVLVGAAAYAQPIPPFIRLAGKPRLGPLALRLLPPSYIMRMGLRMAYHDTSLITTSQVEAYADSLRQPGGRYALSRMARQIVPEDLPAFTAHYPEMNIPTLLIWGREDRIVPLAWGERLAADLPDARLDVLDDCGHIPQEEKPRESMEILRGFLDTL